MLLDYLKRFDNVDVSFIMHQRSKGHGVQHSIVPDDTDLLIILDSSSSEVEECKRLAETMDIVILDHHNLEVDENPYCILVNPRQEGCKYKNKSASATLVTFRFIELMDYKFKKVNTDYYLDLVGMSTLSDQMDMSKDGLENRYFVSEGMKKINNVGLLALVHATRNQDKELDAQIFNFDLIPILNTTARNDQLEKAFAILLEKDFFKAKKMADVLVKDNKARKDKVKHLMVEYEAVLQDEKIILVTTPRAEKGFNGLVSQKLASKHMKPAIVLKDNGKTYSGSGRSYNGFPLQSFLKDCPYVNFAAGHEAAFGMEVDINNWEKFKEYVNDNLDESLFEPVVHYDLEISEEKLGWGIVDEIGKWDRLWGNGCKKINVKLTDVFIESKELFPRGREEHVKLKTDKFDLMKFNEPDYANDVGDWDSIETIGSLGINEWQGNRQLQLFMEDYKKI